MLNPVRNFNNIKLNIDISNNPSVSLKSLVDEIVVCLNIFSENSPINYIVTRDGLVLEMRAEFVRERNKGISKRMNAVNAIFDDVRNNFNCLISIETLTKDEFRTFLLDIIKDDIDVYEIKSSSASVKKEM